jgi:hypothetical protein
MNLMLSNTHFAKRIRVRWKLPLCALLSCCAAATDSAVIAEEPVGRVVLNSLEFLPLPAAADASGSDESVPEPALLPTDFGRGTLAEGFSQEESPFAERFEYSPMMDEHACEEESCLPEHFFEALEAPAEPLADFFACLLCAEHYEVHEELSEHATGLLPVGNRPDLLLESNERFLAAGELSEGIVLPTCAVWRPSFWVWGTYRSAIGHRNNQRGRNFTEWANRLDLFGQLNLTGTERVLVGMRPLDEEVDGRRRRFSGYDFTDGRTLDGWNSDIQTLFFEGDFGEIFPTLDPEDLGGLDFGFSVGRQPMSFQQGLLVNEDMIDALTVTRNTLNGDGNLNMRLTGVYAWKEISRNNGVVDPNAEMVGLFTESDFLSSTVNADIAYVDSKTAMGSVVTAGLSAIQRVEGAHNIYNSSLHVLWSVPTERETVESGRGVLLFSQLSWTPHHREDLVYLNTFWAIDQFTSAARGPLMGGPLGQTGILFASPALGQFGAPLSNQASAAFGGSLGYQLFFDSIIGQQVVFEVGGRKDTNGIHQGEIGSAVRYQKRLNGNWILLVDGFGTWRENEGVGPGARIEMFAKF